MNTIRLWPTTGPDGRPALVRVASVDVPNFGHDTHGLGLVGQDIGDYLSHRASRRYEGGYIMYLDPARPPRVQRLDTRAATMSGRFARRRASLADLGAPDLAAATLEDYAALAVRALNDARANIAATAGAPEVSA